MIRFWDSNIILSCSAGQHSERSGVAACGGRTSSLCSKKLQKLRKICTLLPAPAAAPPLPTLINAYTLTQVLLWLLPEQCADGHSYILHN